METEVIQVKSWYDLVVRDSEALFKVRAQPVETWANRERENLIECFILSEPDRIDIIDLLGTAGPSIRNNILSWRREPSDTECASLWSTPWFCDPSCN